MMSISFNRFSKLSVKLCLAVFNFFRNSVDFCNDMLVSILLANVFFLVYLH